MFFILIIIVLGCTAKTDDLTQRNSNKITGSFTNIWGYEFTERYQRENTLFLDYKLEAERIKLRIIKGVERDFADEIISEKILLFQSLFEPIRTGYPGQHTIYIECPDRFKPKYFEKEIDNGYLKYLIGFANFNFVAGACTDDLIKYKSVHGFMFCNSINTMVEIDYFTALNQIDKIDTFIKKLNCNIE